MFESILSIRVREWLVILVGCKSNVMKDLGTNDSKNSLVGLCSL